MAKQKQMSNQEIAAFCTQMAMLRKSGYTYLSIVEILLEDNNDSNGRDILSSIKSSLEEYKPIYTAIEETGVFPEYVINMIRLGEESGNPDVTLEALADYYNRQEAISESIKNAVSYPMIMILMMLLVIVVLITKVLPIFGQVFEQLGSSMNSFSTSLMKFGERMSSSSIVLVALLVLLLVAYFYFSKFTSGQKIMGRFLNNFGPTKKFYDAVACSRFASGVAMTQAAGMDTFESLDLVSDLVENPRMQAKIADCKKHLEEGESFADALSLSGIFSKIYSKILSVGFTTGAHIETLNSIADSYDNEVDKRIHGIISVLEPTLVIILSLIVGMILLSVILPLMGIMTSIG